MVEKLENNHKEAVSGIYQKLKGKTAIATIRSFLDAGYTIIVVEGEDDVRLYGKFKTENTHIQQSKAGVTEVLKILKYYSDKKQVIGIRDADFADFLTLNEEEIEKRLFRTDCHDAEMMVVSASWEDIYHEYLYKSEHDKDTLYKNTLLRIIFTSLAPLSCLKFQNERDGLKFDFEGIGLEEYVDNNFTFKMKDYLNILNKRSKIKTKILEEKDIESLETIAQSNNSSQKMKNLYEHDLIKFFWCFTNGHDFLKCCAIYSRRSCSKNGINDKQIASSARTAYSLEKFKKTNLYNSIKDYSESNGFYFFR